MWIIKTLKKDEPKRVIYVIPQKPVLVGKLKVDIIIEKDSSISRKHCSLNCARKEECPKPVTTKTGCWVVDLGSKYGTFILEEENFSKIEPNQPVLLIHGSTIRFGILDNMWRVEYCPVHIAASTVPVEMKQDLRKQIVNIGGEMVTVVNLRCNFLVAIKITLTPKILLAMIYGIPIVKPKFISEFLKAVNEHQELPDPEKFRPVFDEAVIRTSEVNLRPGFKRDVLFKGMQFYAMSTEHLNCFKEVVEAAGGSISIFDMKHKHLLLEKNAVMLESCRVSATQATESQVSQTTSELRAFLDSHGRRTVPDREIPLAIAYASIARMCNTESLSLGPSTEQHVSQSTVLEDSTQNKSQFTVDTAQVIESTLSQQLQASFRDAAPSQSMSSQVSQGFGRPGPSSLGATMMSRKRAGSLDISQSENSKKRLALGSAVHIRSDIGIKSAELGIIREDGPSNSKKSGESLFSTRKEVITTSQIPIIGRFVEDVSEENPFGKRKISTEELHDKILKKSRVPEPSPQQDSYDRATEVSLSNQTTSRRASLQENPATLENNKNPFTSTVKHSYDVPATSSGHGAGPSSSSEAKTVLPTKNPRYSDVPATSSGHGAGPSSSSEDKTGPPNKNPRSSDVFAVPQRVEPRRASFGNSALPCQPSEADAEGWIDMTERKDGENAGAGLSDTIIMLSLVTLAGRKQFNTTTNGSIDGLRNVKVFHKQSFPGFNRTIEFQSLPDFQESWTRITR